MDSEGQKYSASDELYGYDPGGKCYARKGSVHGWLDSHLKTADHVTSLPCSGFPQIRYMCKSACVCFSSYGIFGENMYFSLYNL